MRIRNGKQCVSSYRRVIARMTGFPGGWPTTASSVELHRVFDAVHVVQQPGTMVREITTDRNALSQQSTAPAVINLANASVEEVQNFLSSFDIVLSDCDGVIWYLGKPIPGATEAVSSLQQLGKRLFLVTNNSTINIDRFCEKMQLNGLSVQPMQVINSAKAIAWYMKKINFSGEAFVIASSTFRQVLIDEGIKLVSENCMVTEEDVTAMIGSIQNQVSIKAIVVDFSLFFDWVKMTIAIACLNRKDVLYICGTTDEWIACGHDKKILGPGPLIDIITKYSKRSPIKCAKPSEVLRTYVLEKCNVKDPKRCLFIGDTINHDMKFSTMCGFKKLFVGTGLDSIKDAEQNEETRPDFYIPSLGLLNPIIDSLHNSANDKNGC